MMWPPSILRIRIAHRGRRGFGLWIPVFLLWPLMLLIVLLAPAIIAAVPKLRHASGAKSAVLSGPHLLAAFCAARGLRVDVRDEQDSVFIAFW